MSLVNGGNKTLPLTGTALVIGSTAVPAPKLAAIAALIIIGGFLLLRLTRPKRLEGVVPGRPGRARVRVWRRGAI
ncbi:hypothetical protein [Paractinoplanes rishiriensis]|uniref:Uncharacterized protein n=1 Tax=Paractinoplanes rishiriensis TaxID=1050105 RepID=A0A919MY37_9ACTN|nr:hypothetical protein [Actinoplanes rishiriensis]GIE99683.1 hypothetical protein Ari01nite_71480 [Actinoplanes rishiriensis]